ncbi:MAG: hypothetical protein NT062_04425 [Proteobacteria bacterium]|nr:hypothetical protein [Pseudomonadota bacterium]
MDAPAAFVEKPIGYDGKDGGEIRIENFVFPDGVTHILTTAYFIDKQAVDNVPFPHIVNDNMLDCNPNTDHIYPFADGSNTLGVLASWAPGGRHYMDVGPKITLGATDGSKPSWDMPLYENFITPFMGGSFHNLTYNVPAGMDPLLTIDPAKLGGQGADTNAQLKVTIPGGPDAPATVFDFKDGLKGIEIPPRPVVAGFSSDGCAYNTSDANCPGRMKAGANFATGGGIQLSRSAVFDRTYTVSPSAPPDMLMFVAVFGPVGVHMLCVSTKPGHVTIPASTMATMPDGGIMFIAHLLHRTRTFDNIHRVDMVGTSCTSIGFNMVP